DLIAPHVAAGAQRIVAKRIVTPPRRRRRIGITTGTRVEQTDHAELGCVAQSRLTCDVRIGVVRGALYTVAIAGRLGVGVTHGTLFALGARAGAALFVVGRILGDLLRLLLLHLLFGGGIEILLNEILLVGGDAVLVRHAHWRHEERHRSEETRMGGE